MTTVSTTNDTDPQQSVSHLDDLKIVDEVAVAPTGATATSSRSLRKKKKNSKEEEEVVVVVEGGRERIKRHRKEVAGRVWIPEIWGQEELLKDWTDCTGFEASFVNTSVMSARAALIEEGRRRAANSAALRMERSC